jgi:protein ImuA
MLSLGEDILPIAPGVRTPTFTRRASHLSLKVTTASTASEALAATGAVPLLLRSASDVGRGGPTLQRPTATGKNPRLAELAEQIRQLHCRYRTSASCCPSGLPELDAALGGGFVMAAVHELVVANEGAPAASVALWTATQAAGRQKWILYIDTRHELYPPAVAQLGVPLGRLMVVRASRAADALWVCEQALRCQAVAAVVLPLRSIDAYASRRLQLAAEAGGSLGLLICQDQRGGHTFAASRLRIEPLIGPEGARQVRITVLKLREGRPGEPFVVEWPDAADSVPASAVLGDRAGATRRCVGG